MKLYLDNTKIDCIPDTKTEEVYMWQARTLPMEEFDKKYGESEGPWKSKGINHKDSNGWCFRQIKVTLEYFIIDNVEELVELIGRNKLYIYSEDAPSKEETNIYFVGEYDYLD